MDENATHINWLRFITPLSTKIITETIEPLTSEKRKNTFIADDLIFDVCPNHHGLYAGVGTGDVPILTEDGALTEASGEIAEKIGKLLYK